MFLIFFPYTYHKSIDGHPAVIGETLHEWDKKLNTSIPMRQDQRHQNQVDYPYHSALYVQNLKEKYQQSSLQYTDTWFWDEHLHKILYFFIYKGQL